MSLISPNFVVKSIIFSQFWPGAFSKIAGKSPLVNEFEVATLEQVICQTQARNL